MRVMRPVRRGLVPNLFSAAAQGAISTKERLQYVRYQCSGFDRFVESAVLDRMGIARPSATTGRPLAPAGALPAGASPGVVRHRAAVRRCRHQK